MERIMKVVFYLQKDYMRRLGVPNSATIILVEY
jgi:hypothetical protein